MASQQYRVVLTGELVPGFSPEAALAAMAEVFETPVSDLRGVFDGGEHPVKQTFSADDALELQSRLDRIGVRCRIERLSENKVELQLRKGAAASESSSASLNEAGKMRCPACGHEQLVSNRCDACGIVFAQYHRQAAQAQPKQPTAGNPPVDDVMPRPAQPRPQDHWRDTWGDFVDDAEPDEQSYLGLFFGEKAEDYLGACQRYVKGPRTRFSLSWNWGAVFSPFIWALYRKMWGWAMVMFITEIFLPALLIILGSYDMPSHKLVYLGYAGLVANRLFWPAVANFLYCRHARVSLQRLHMMSPNYAAEIDIATAGGVSNSSVLVGLAIAGVMSVFLWSVVDSVHDSSRQAQQQRLVDAGSSQLTDSEGRRTDDVTGVGGSAEPIENKWIATRKKLRALGQKVNSWLAQHAAVDDAAQLNLFRLREELSLKASDMTDGWGGEVQYIPDTEGYRLISSGPDRLFGTADDIQYRRVLSQ